MALLSAGVTDDSRLGRSGNGTSPGPVSVPIGHIISMAAGERFSVVLYSNARAAYWGNNSDFEIGLSRTLGLFNQPETAPLSELPAVFVSVTACERRATYVSSSGQVFLSGQAFTEARALCRVELPSSVTKAVTGASRTWAIDGSGTIYEIDSSGRFTQYTIPGGALEIAAGLNFAVAVNASGQCFGTGSFFAGDPAGMAQIPFISMRVARVFAGFESMIVCDAGGNMGACIGVGQKSPSGLGIVAVRNTAQKGIRQIAIGRDFQCFVTEDNRLFARGRGRDGVLLTGDTRDALAMTQATAVSRPVAAIAAGRSHVLVLLADPASNPQSSSMGGTSAVAGTTGMTYRGGDVVRLEKQRFGHVIGARGAGIAVQFSDGFAVLPASQLEFVTRDGYIGIDHADGGDLLHRLFGLTTGDVVRRRGGEGGLATVIGIRDEALRLSQPG
jgi:alpha-tubulin suppressor-like RCC1 family protein